MSDAFDGNGSAWPISLDPSAATTLGRNGSQLNEKCDKASVKQALAEIMLFEGWTSFFSAEVDACATLTGLIVVAISINLGKILAEPHLPARAGEALFTLVVAFVLCSAALMPELSATIYGALAIGLAGFSLAFGVRNHVVWRRTDRNVEWTRQIVSAFGRIVSAVPVGVGGALLLAHSSHAVGWIAWGVLAALAASVLNAWVLLVEIIR